jgi:phage shock protein A
LLRLDDLEREIARLERQIAETRGQRSAEQASTPPAPAPVDITPAPGV